MSTLVSEDEVVPALDWSVEEYRRAEMFDADADVDVDVYVDIDVDIDVDANVDVDCTSKEESLPLSFFI